MPENLISAFRTGYNPRIAVTVDMIATGTDIKPLEVLLFMRAVRSRVLFEQMLGRGTRVISETDFQAVTTTPNAHKTRFVIVDAVGVTEQELMDTGTVERKRSVPLKSLLEAVAVGAVDDDLLASLARRLSLMEKRLSAGRSARRSKACWMCPPRPSASRTYASCRMPCWMRSTRTGFESRPGRMRSGPGSRTNGHRDWKTARQELVERAVVPLAASPELRNYLLEREILIDETSLDTVHPGRL